MTSASRLDELLDQSIAAAAAGGQDGLRTGSRPSSAGGSVNSTAVLLAMGCVEPAVTAQAIKRRKAAAAVGAGVV